MNNIRILKYKIVDNKEIILIRRQKKETFETQQKLAYDTKNLRKQVSLGVEVRM